MVPLCVVEPSTSVTFPLAEESVGALLPIAAIDCRRIAAAWLELLDAGALDCWAAPEFEKVRRSADKKERIFI